MKKAPFLSNRMYDVLKWFVTIVLPASGAAVIGLGELWDWSMYVEIAGTIAIATTFLGAVLQVSSRAYKKTTPLDAGVIDMASTATDDGLKTKIVLKLDMTPEELEAADRVTLKVDNKGVVGSE